ncbi:Uncharacterised protein [Klebsiella pneumoniae]|nr:Uncharacterised protein [Klebsiella pneumoniae]
MEVIEGDFIYSVGEMDAGGTDIGHVHVHRQRFYLIKLMIRQATQITGKTFYTAIICQLQSTPLPVRDNGDVLVSFFEADFIHAEMTCR